MITKALEKAGILKYQMKKYYRFKRHVNTFLDRAEKQGEIEKIIRISSFLFRKEYEMIQEIFGIRAEIGRLLGDAEKYESLIQKEGEIFSELYEKIKNLSTIEKNKKYN